MNKYLFLIGVILLASNCNSIKNRNESFRIIGKWKVVDATWSNNSPSRSNTIVLSEEEKKKKILEFSNNLINSLINFEKNGSYKSTFNSGIQIGVWRQQGNFIYIQTDLNKSKLRIILLKEKSLKLKLEDDNIYLIEAERVSE